MKKILQAILIVAVLIISTVAPSAVSKASAATLSVSDYIFEKDGKLYAMDAATYLEMKAAGLPSLQELRVTHVKSSEGNIYELDVYLDAKAGTDKGTMSQTLQLLEGKGLEADVQPGKVIVDGDGDVSLEESDGSVEEPEEEFKVISIE